MTPLVCTQSMQVTPSTNTLLNKRIVIWLGGRPAIQMGGALQHKLRVWSEFPFPLPKGGKQSIHNNVAMQLEVYSIIFFEDVGWGSIIVFVSRNK